jgi:hypothetical protein
MELNVIQIIFGQMNAVLFNPTVRNLEAAPLLIIAARNTAMAFSNVLFGSIADEAEFTEACGLMAEIHECIEDFEDKVAYLSNLN